MSSLIRLFLHGRLTEFDHCFIISAKLEDDDHQLTDWLSHMLRDRVPGSILCHFTYISLLTQPGWCEGGKHL